MAKLTGFVGTASGRIGNMVYSKGRNGATIARAYQPQVSNPNSGKQVATRARFTLSTKIAAALKTSGAMFLRAEGYAPTDRGELVRRLMQVTSVGRNELQPSTVNLVNYAQGLRPVGDFLIEQPVITKTDNAGITATLTIPESYRAVAGTMASIVVVAVPSTKVPNIGTNVVSTQAVALNNGESTTSTLVATMPQAVVSELVMGNVYAYGIVAVPSTGNVIAGRQSLNSSWGAIYGGYAMAIEYLATGNFIFSNLAVSTSTFSD